MAFVFPISRPLAPREARLASRMDPRRLLTFVTFVTFVIFVCRAKRAVTANAAD